MGWKSNELFIKTIIPTLKMTEQQFQECRKIMQQANSLRGYITKAKGEVARWTHIESSCREALKERQADGAKKIILGSIERLNKLRQKFANLKFPE